MAHGPTDRQLLGAGGGRGQSARAGAGVAVGHRSLLPRLAGADRGLRDQRLGDLGGDAGHQSGIVGLAQLALDGLRADLAGELGHTTGDLTRFGETPAGGGGCRGDRGDTVESCHGCDAGDSETDLGEDGTGHDVAFLGVGGFF